MTEKDIPYIDSHFHIWDLTDWKSPWPSPDDVILYRNYSIDEYGSNIRDTPVKGAVFIQVLQKDPNETRWVLAFTKSHPFLKGVVGGLDLTDPNLGALLDEFQQYPQFVGVRHILDFEVPEWITQEDVHRGLALLQDRSLTFDLLLRPHLLKYIPDLLAKFPRLRFVVNHIAKPLIKEGKIEDWKSGMSKIADYPNVSCKISGLVTEADLQNWKVSDFVPYVEHILEIFGEDRVMFGSDWPVCNVAGANYKQVLDLAKDLTHSITPQAKKKFFYENAKRIYNLKDI